MKAFQEDPYQNPEVFLAELATRQFGRIAGQRMYRAWEEMRRAFDVWNDLPFGPLDGSQGILSIGTSVPLPPPSLPGIVTDPRGQTQLDTMLTILTNVEPWRADDYRKFREKSFADRMALMAGHLARAADFAKEAAAEASDTEFIGICHYEDSSGLPTRKAYAELNWASIAIAEHVCLQRVNMLRAYHLLSELETRCADDEDPGERTSETRYGDLLRNDVALAERFVVLLTEFSAMRPCLTRTGMTEREIEGHIATMRKKIEQIKDYVDTAGRRHVLSGRHVPGSSATRSLSDFAFFLELSRVYDRLLGQNRTEFDRILKKCPKKTRFC